MLAFTGGYHGLKLGGSWACSVVLMDSGILLSLLWLLGCYGVHVPVC